MKSPKDGRYKATCKERNALAAAMNGHASVYPDAQCTIKALDAEFTRNGVVVWRCNAAYANAHFRLEQID